jgi:hypothetical protein
MSALNDYLGSSGMTSKASMHLPMLRHFKLPNRRIRAPSDPAARPSST